MHTQCIYSGTRAIQHTKHLSLPCLSIWNLAGIVSRPCQISRILVKGYLVVERYIKGQQDETQKVRVNDQEKPPLR